MNDTDNWIVGLDLGERSRGALAVAHWLAHGSDRITGVHVLETWSRPYIADNIITTVHRLVAKAAGELGISPPSRVVVVEAAHAEDALRHAADGASGLVIGRAARMSEDSLIRLGHVARRLLRTLPVPIVVVPPDLTAVAPGPVLLASDLEPVTSAALAFARRLADDHDRPLEVVHVGEDRRSELIEEFEPAWLSGRDEFHATVERTVNEWMHDNGLQRLTRHIAYGDPAQQIAAIAARRRAAAVVVGSRHLTAVARVFISSTASALAATAGCPVIVVR